MNFNEEINNAMSNYIKSDKFKEEIEQKAEKMITNIIDDAFGWNGGIKKQIEDLIKEQVKINTDELSFSGHNKFITEVVAKHLKKCLRSDAEKEITKNLEKIISPVDKVISIETLRDTILKSADLSDYDCSCGDVDIDYILENYLVDELITFEVEKNYLHEWIDIYIDKKPNKDRHQCEFNLTVHKSFTSFRTREREFRATDRAFDYQFDFEDYLYQLFLNNSTIDYNSCLEYVD